MKKAKQFLAMLLCLCMVMAVIPANAQQAAATDGDTSVVFNFVYDRAELVTTAVNKLNRPNAASQPTNEAMKLIEATTYDLTGRNWHFLTYPEAAWTGVENVWNKYLSFHTNGINLQMTNANRWVALVLDIEDAADYNVKLNHAKYYNGGISEVYMFPKPADTSASGIAACLTEGNLLGTFDCCDGQNAMVEDSTSLKDINVENASEYVLVFRGTGTKHTASKAYYSLVSSLTLTKKETVSANFGEHYAYMEKTDAGSYKLTVIGGIKDIAGYSQVGFEVTCNGEALTPQSSKNVYETITHDGTAIDTSKLGTDINYLFYQTFEITEAEISSLSFRAYGVGAEGNEYGATYVLK